MKVRTFRRSVRKGRYFMTNGDKLRRITRKRAKDDEKAGKEVDRYYEEGMKEGHPRKKRAITPTSEATAEKMKGEQEAKEMLSGERSSVEGQKDVMNVVIHASRSILGKALSDDRGAGSSKQV